jgi:1,4-alpha-glucan branching enzyme
MATAERIAGMGAIPHEHGVAFRVWAPNAEQVSVIGSFNRWDCSVDSLDSEGNGYWYGNVPKAKIGDEYKFMLWTQQGVVARVDPYARQVTNSVGNGVIHDPAFDWEDDGFTPPNWNEMVIYEMHVGTFDENPEQPTGTFTDVLARINHLKRLGVNTIQIMPVAEFAGDRSWGYNPAHIFAVETAYGGPKGLKHFVNTMHKNGIAVFLDVVYNHFGPSDLDLWTFDGWREGEGGGIYFYNDHRGQTPWGHTRPDYGRGEVRAFLRDNALMWLDEYHIDGLRFDGTAYIHKVDGPGSEDIPEGWSLLQWINQEIADKFPGHATIAEDLQNNEALTRDVEHGGAGFSAQWDAGFVHPIRAAVIGLDDAQRAMPSVAAALTLRYNTDAFERVIYSESHDEVASGKARVPHEISPEDPKGWYAQKRSTLASGLTFTAPGIPMLFQGQEFLADGWFRDDTPLNWHEQKEYRGIVLLYRDLINLRLNRDGYSGGLRGQHIHVHHVNDQDKVIAFHRWADGGPGDDVVVIANFTTNSRDNYIVGFPAEGVWKCRFNSDAQIYSQDFGGHPSFDVTAGPGNSDDMPAQAAISIGPYSVLIYSQEPGEQPAAAEQAAAQGAPEQEEKKSPARSKKKNPAAKSEKPTRGDNGQK